MKFCFVCTDTESRDEASAVLVGGRVEDERLDAGHGVEAREDQHEGDAQDSYVVILHCVHLHD